jgi:hypothetical protein
MQEGRHGMSDPILVKTDVAVTVDLAHVMRILKTHEECYKTMFELVMLISDKHGNKEGKPERRLKIIR